MFRWLRILIAMLVVAAFVTAIHALLGLEGMMGEAVDLGLMIGGLFLVSVSDRELFWAVPPKHGQRTRHHGGHA